MDRSFDLTDAPSPRALWDADLDDHGAGLDDTDLDEAVLDEATMEPGLQLDAVLADLSSYEGDEPWLVPELPFPIWDDGSPAELDELDAGALHPVH